MLIGTNELRDGDWEFSDDLFSPWLSELRRCSPVFKEEGRPANFLTGIAAACVKKSSLWTEWMFVGKESGSTPSPQSERVPPLLFAQVLGLYHEQLETVPSTAELTGLINRLADYVDALDREGSTCVFFEMPIDSSLAHLTGPTTLRRMMQARFPPGRYHWIGFEHDHNYETKDGVHLTEAEARNVTETIVNHVNQIVPAVGSRIPQTSQPTSSARRLKETQ